MPATPQSNRTSPSRQRPRRGHRHGRRPYRAIRPGRRRLGSRGGERATPHDSWSPRDWLKLRPGPSPWAWADTWRRRRISEHYDSEREREIPRNRRTPGRRNRGSRQGISRLRISAKRKWLPSSSAICGNQKRWVDFMMRFELGLEEPDPRRANRSAVTIAASYVFGGLIPLAPYMVLPT